LIACLGISDLVVVRSGDITLVAHKTKVNQIKELLANLNENENLRNFSRIAALLFLVGVLSVPCFGAPRKGKGGKTLAERGFDPLELPADTRIVPKRISPSSLSAAGYSTSPITGARPDSAAPVADSVSGQIFRVQIFTSNLFGEARRAASVAEEIFDQPVYLDYDVPYFKIRVGDFARRRDAEDYQRKVTTAGYPTALVVVANPFVRQAPPLYDSLAAPLPPDTSAIKDSTLIKKDTPNPRE